MRVTATGSLFALLLLALPAIAAPKLELKGFTADDAAFAYVLATHGDAESRTAAVVVDVKSGAETTYVLDETGADGPPDDARQAALAKEKAAFEAWLAAHPLTPPVRGRKSPDGKLVAQAEATGTEGAWNGDSYGWTGQDCDDPAAGALCASKGTIALFVNAGDKRRKVGASSWLEAKGTVVPWWAKDGRAVVFVNTIVHLSAMFEDEPRLVVARTGGPGIELVVAKEFAAATPRVTKALEGASYLVTRVTPALKKREKTVLYVAPGFEEAAKGVAAAVPGGASIEPLTWKTEAEIAVAVGASAL